MSSNKNLVGLVCADARLHTSQVRIIEAAAKLLGIEDVYVLAKPGPDRILKAPDHHRQALVDDFKLLIDAKNPAGLFVMGHYQCAGNPVSDDEHDFDTRNVADLIKKETGFAGPVTALVAVHKTDTDWDLKEVGTF